MAAKKKANYGLLYTPQDVVKALDVLEAYIKERVDLVLNDKIEDVQTSVKMFAAIQDFAEMVKVRAKSPAENFLNTIRFTLIPTLMDSDDITNIGVDDVGKCRLQDDITVKVEDPERLNIWLTENALEDIIKETVNVQTLTAQIRGRMKENADIAAAALKAGTPMGDMQKLLKALPPQDIVKVTPIVRAQLTRE